MRQLQRNLVKAFRHVRRYADVYVTLVVAVSVAFLGIFGADGGVLSSAILAVLALVAVNLLLSRIGNDKTQKELLELAALIEPRSDNFPNFSRTQPAITGCIRKSISEKGGVTVQVIGVSMHRSWLIIRDIIAEHSEDALPRERLRFEFAILDDDWKQENGLWHGRTSYIDDEIARFMVQKRFLLEKGKLEILVFHYAQKPSIAGFLINGQDYFKGTCEIVREDGEFIIKVAENPWERYRATDEVGRREIAQFSNLLEWYRANCRAPARRYGQEADHSQPPPAPPAGAAR
jgi:hypothetical protein